jgi:hypothetical protein
VLSSPKAQQLKLRTIEEEICAQISWDNKLVHLRKLGRREGWPIEIDFMPFVTNILALESDDKV